MGKWFKALQLGMMILTAIEEARGRRPAEVSVEWKGRMYTLTLTQD